MASNGTNHKSRVLFVAGLLNFGLAAGLTADQTTAQTSAPSSLPTVEQILARHVRAIGGSDAWAKVSTLTRKGVGLPDVANFPMETYSKAPDKWILILNLSKNRVFRHAFDGSTGWEDAGAPKLMERDAVFEEGLMYNPFWTLRPKDYFPSLIFRGIEKNGEHQVYVIEATPAQGRPKTLYFDARTGLLTRAGKIMFDDYREVDGVKVPYLVRYGFQTFKFSEIRHGTTVEDERFKMPEIPKKPAEERPAEPLPSADQIMDRYVQAAGGESVLSKWKSQARTGTLQEDNETVPVETFAKAPSKWLFVARPEAGGADREGYDGAAGWSESSDVIKEMASNRSVELGSFLDFQWPLKLSRLRSKMTVKRKETRGPREFYVVDVSFPEGPQQRMYFDTGTGMLRQVDNTIFEDYRDVDGLKLPFTVKLRGGHTTINFTEVRHDVPVEDAQFRKPAPSPAFEKNFAGLEAPQVLPVLKRVIGQGVSPSDGRLLYDLIVERGYKRALDIGTAKGYGALWFGVAMKKNRGKVITIEIDPETADEARENFRQAGLSGVIDSRINDALLEIPQIPGEFDFVFMDTGVPLNKKFLDLLYSRIKPGGAILAHNASGFQAEQPDFLKAIETDPNLETKIIKTKSGGISLSVKRQ